jgi:hypothetical protein
MTELEREWRQLSRRDSDSGLMDLWARIAPRSWIDRKCWRDAPAAAQLNAAIALASDPDGVEAAEAAATALGATLERWKAPIGRRIRWRPYDQDFDRDLLAGPLEAAREALATRDGASIVLAYAQKLEKEVHDEALSLEEDRAPLAASLGRAAYVDALWGASTLDPDANPVTPLRALWTTGYVVSTVDAQGMTLAFPPL